VLFADDACLKATGHKDDILRKLQCGFTSLQSWCERRIIKINEDKTKVVYFSHRYRLVEADLEMKERPSPL
jgi:hypothetical protein